MAPSRAGMDAASYLKKQGWKGDGHSLDPTSRGIKKPLLVSKKVDVLGLGVNKHAAVTDQWWMRAFDAGLKDLGTGKKSTLQSIRDNGHYAGGLYGRFVKGKALTGTFDPEAEESTSKKRKRAEGGSEAVKKPKVAKEDDELRRRREDVDRKVDGFVDEAKRRGLILDGDSDRRLKTSWLTVALYGEDAVQRVLKEVGLESRTPSASAPANAQKFSREKQERELRRVARELVISKLPEPERKKLEEYEASGRREKKQKRKAKEDEKTQKEAAKVAAKEAKALLRKEKHEKKQAERQEATNEDSTYRSDEAKEIKAKASAAKYQAKAKAKGLTVEEYIQRREQRKGAGTGLDSATTTAPTTRDPTPDGLGFVVDTIGDATLGVEKDANAKDVVIDPHGHVRYTVVPEIAVPLDPTIWEGIDVKSLPRAVREARRQWMENKRSAKKSANGGLRGVKKKVLEKSKGEKKIEKVQELVIKILVRSRKAGDIGGTATIDGIEEVPLVKVGKKADGAFTLAEMSLARTVARRVLKEQKRKAVAVR